MSHARLPARAWRGLCARWCPCPHPQPVALVAAVCTGDVQICMFCWNKIRETENGCCPGCRSKYSDQPQTRVLYVLQPQRRACTCIHAHVVAQFLHARPCAHQFVSPCARCDCVQSAPRTGGAHRCQHHIQGARSPRAGPQHLARELHGCEWR
ncbi:hypothetical protein EON66_11735 [archaeon]|nr:MAG: hypothetical protein EON66_11735 [archaeon]